MLYEWTDTSGDIGHVNNPVSSPGFVELWMEHKNGPRPDEDESPTACHFLTPSGARDLAAALIRSADEADKRTLTIGV